MEKRTAIRLFLIVALMAMFSLNALARSGDVDPTFNASLAVVPGGLIVDSAIQSDGKIVVVGEIGLINGKPRSILARLNADGSLDTSFVPPSIENLGAGYAILSVAIQSDGKILIGGQLGTINGVPRKGIARLNPDGSPDTAFNSSPAIANVVSVNQIRVATDNKILFGGVKNIGGPSNQTFLMLLNADGSLNQETGNDGYAFLFLPDGKILRSGFSGVTRLMPDLSSDSSFTTIGLAGQLARQSDGKIIIAGGFNTYNGFPVGQVARLNADGTFDATFNQNGTGVSAVSQVYTVTVLPDDRVVVGGNFNSFNGTSRGKMAILNSDGTLDKASVPQVIFNSVNDLEMMGGKLVVSGGPPPQNPFIHGAAVRLNFDGTRDNGFMARTGRVGVGHRIAIQPGGKVVVAGVFNDANDTSRNALSVFQTNGTVDGGFDQSILTYSNYQRFALATQADGKVLIGGVGGGLNLKRLNTDGSTDIEFPNTLVVRDVAVQPDGKVLVGGRSGDHFMRRYLSDGSLDPNFNTTVNEYVYKIIVQPDSKILIAGEFTTVNSINRSRIARLNSDGSLDTTFNPTAGANGTVFDMGLQSTGQIVIGGVFSGVSFSNQKYVARLNSDGSLDSSFSPVLSSNGQSDVSAVAIQSDDKVLIGGSFTTVNGNNTGHVVRLTANGSLDFRFAWGNPIGTIYDIAIQPDGAAIVTGDFSSYGGNERAGIVRLQNTSFVTPFDYDGDARSDVSVFRASENKWYVLRSSDFSVQQTIFATSGDIPAPADYDGDTKTDLAIFRPSSGQWWYKSSINGAHVNVQWGQAGDIPRPSDFDGDGKTDLVVYRPSNSVWYRYGSTGVTSILAFGLAEDKPLIGDFDGDGRSDIAIFRPSTGDWWYSASGSGGAFRATHWGQAGDIPAPGDYDGDGKADFAVFRPTEGGWYIANSSNGTYVSTTFGLPGDRPIPGDYDGDGRTDISVFRPSTGIWYLLQTNAGFGALQFGISTDVPTESSYLP